MKFRCETCCRLLEIQNEPEIICPTCGSVYNKHTAIHSHLKWLSRHQRGIEITKMKEGKRNEKRRGNKS